VLDRVATTISRHGMFAPGQRVGVAVSGGADSVCLVYVLHELAQGLDLSLSVLHLNHQMRGAESDADEEYVRELAAGFGLPLHSMRADVPRIAAETGDNLEQAARRVRREFFLDFLRRGVLDRVALGHTRSDQAETVLFRFLRGSGIAGLAGIWPVTPEGLVRPLIEIDRGQVRQYLAGRGIAWREDSSNSDCRFARNRIRHDLLPGLAQDWNPALAETLARMATVARNEEEYWEAEIGRIAAGRLVLRPPAVLFRTDWLRSLPEAVARRVIRHAIQRAKGELRDLDMEHVERILELTGISEGSGRLQVPGLDVFKSFDWVRLAPPGIDTLANRDYDLPAPVPGLLRLPRGGAALSLELITPEASGAACVYNEGGTELDWGRISGGLRVRNWRPGDRYRPVGRTSETKIKLLFQDARIPLWERRRWPVITCGESIVWAARFGTAADYAASPQTHTVLRVRELGEITES
jgi:tRNA(Ile)-lysidine synthase